MQNELRIQTLQRMLKLIDTKALQPGEEGQLEVAHYTDPQHLQAELKTLFRNYPIIIAHSSQLQEPGTFVAMDIGHVPVLAIRDRKGVLRAFINACRHRGSRLTAESTGKAKAFVCPYHGWTYQDSGNLKFVPQQEGFPSLEPSKCSLAQLPVAEAGGFIWVVPGGTEVDITSWLAGVREDLDGFSLSDHVVYKQAQQPTRANWKLIIDAFSEGYHLRTLHKDSVKPFFLEHGVVFDRLGPHSRSVGGRKELLQAKELPTEQWDFRAWTTPFYNLFPNTILVFHPDWISRITVYPDGTDQSIAHHEMLVHKDQQKPDKYWDRTFALINNQVFAAEDLAVCEQIQVTARSGADTHWPIGTMETPVLWFHQACELALTGASPEAIVALGTQDVIS